MTQVLRERRSRSAARAEAEWGRAIFVFVPSTPPGHAPARARNNHERAPPPPERKPAEPGMTRTGGQEPIEKSQSAAQRERRRGGVERFLFSCRHRLRVTRPPAREIIMRERPHRRSGSQRRHAPRHRRITKRMGSGLSGNDEGWQTRPTEEKPARSASGGGVGSSDFCFRAVSASGSRARPRTK